MTQVISDFLSLHRMRQDFCRDLYICMAVKCMWASGWKTYHLHPPIDSHPWFWGQASNMPPLGYKPQSLNILWTIYKFRVTEEKPVEASSYYPFKKYVESESFFFQFTVQAWCHLSPCLNDHSYSWVVNLLQLDLSRLDQNKIVKTECLNHSSLWLLYWLF